MNLFAKSNNSKQEDISEINSMKSNRTKSENESSVSSDHLVRVRKMHSICRRHIAGRKLERTTMKLIAESSVIEQSSQNEPC